MCAVSPTGTGAASSEDSPDTIVTRSPSRRSRPDVSAPQELGDLVHDGVEDLLLRRLGRDERGDPPQRGLLVDERPQPGLVAAPPLELGRGARGEDPQRGELLLVGVQRRPGQHAEVADVPAVEAPQRHREVAVQAHLDDHLVAGKRSRTPDRVRDQIAVADLGARRALEAVLHRLGEPAALPAGEEPRVVAVLGDDLGDERDVRAERQRGVLDETLEELLADRSCGPLGEEPEEVLVLGGDRHGRPTLPMGQPSGGCSGLTGWAMCERGAGSTLHRMSVIEVEQPAQALRRARRRRRRVVRRRGGRDLRHPRPQRRRQDHHRRVRRGAPRAATAGPSASSGTTPRRDPAALRELARRAAPGGRAARPSSRVREALDLYASFYRAPADPARALGRAGARRAGATARSPSSPAASSSGSRSRWRSSATRGSRSSTS